ncbi:MAG: ATP-dependent Clp protease adapter ClpS [Propionibacteriaceae bacterium]|jgi:ATP-dependent Clp protease adaptor protein ClpS|nr:ATP-dependent Clp protease adapter ClpS [Propionibacteriaceae bacterium]
MDAGGDRPAGGTAVKERVADKLAAQLSWVTVVWDDPVNLMVYVTHVFQTHFGYPKSKAHRLMMQVHTEGKAVVASGSKEQMESAVDAMHSYGLWATMEQA